MSWLKGVGNKRKKEAKELLLQTVKDRIASGAIVASWREATLFGKEAMRDEYDVPAYTRRFARRFDDRRTNPKS
jgi:hypothetical protein